MFTIAPSSKSSESRAKASVLGINLNTDRLTRGNQRQTDGRIDGRARDTLSMCAVLHSALSWRQAERFKVRQ